MDRGAWQAADHEVTKSRTQLSDLTHTAHTPTQSRYAYWGRILKSLSFAISLG